MEFVELTEKEFDKFVNNHEQASYMQSLDLKKFKENNNIKCYLVGVKEKNKVLAATLMYSIGTFMKKKRFYSSRGFIIDYKNKDLLKFFVENIKKYIKDKNGI